MARIFICYRREEGDAAGRLRSELEQRLPSAELFMDVDDLPAGVDFVTRLDSELAVADVVIVVIGKAWLTLRDGAGQRRLDDPADFVRREVAAALDRTIPTIPVLVQGASMPGATDLPDALNGLSRRQFVELRHARYHDDVAELARQLLALLPRNRKSLRSRAVRWIAPAAALVVVIAIAYVASLPKYVHLDLAPYANDRIDWLTSDVSGEHRFDLVPFTILSGPRAVVKTQTIGHEEWPQAVSIAAHAWPGVTRLHLLLSGNWAFRERGSVGRLNERGRVGALVIRYWWGDDKWIDLIDGLTIQETWKYQRDLALEVSPRSVAGVQWRTVHEESQLRGPDQARAFLDLLSVEVHSWRPIRSVDLRDTSRDAGLVLAALTFER